ncbi:hypothetical protein ACKUZO_003790 [Acinetobacter baumannii]
MRDFMSYPQVDWAWIFKFKMKFLNLNYRADFNLKINSSCEESFKFKNREGNLNLKLWK